MNKISGISTTSVCSLSVLTSPASSFSFSSNGDNEESESEGENDEEDSSEVDHEPQRKDRNTVKWVLTNEAYCFDVKRFSEKLVGATLTEAHRYLTLRERDRTARVSDVIAPIIADIVKQIPKADSHRLSELAESSAGHPDANDEISGTDDSLLNWPKISEFNIKVGLEKVEDYVSRWVRADDWLFCVEFLGFESEDCSNVFVYEVEWSKPTKEYPIPQATASVYFALEVFKMVPYNFDRSVEVTYVFESSTTIHAPGRIDFQETWLYNIINAKLRFFKTVTFGTPIGEKECEKAVRLRETRKEDECFPRF